MINPMYRGVNSADVVPSSTALPSVNVLAVRVHRADVSTLLDLASAWIGEAASRTIMYVNAHCLNIAQQDSDYRAVLNSADLVYADGVAVAWASRWLGGPKMRRATGADWIEPFCALAEKNQWRLYIVAGAPGVAAQAVDALQARYPRLCVAGIADGFFSARNEEETILDIVATAPDVVLIGMGVPRQEKWLATHRHRLPAPVCWTVGALFDYLAGVERRAPAWMRRLALEWCWRLFVDPIGKWRRYVVGNPLFVYRVMRQKWTDRATA